MMVKASAQRATWEQSLFAGQPEQKLSDHLPAFQYQLLGRQLLGLVFNFLRMDLHKIRNKQGLGGAQ